MNKIDIFMASLPRQLHVVETVKSLLLNPEVLTITITANKYSDIEFRELGLRLNAANTETQIPIYLHRGDNKKESNEKLKYVGKGQGKYIGLMDDDLIVPSDYYQKMISACEQYNAMVSLHGVKLAPLPIRSYYADRQVYRGLGTVLNDMEVDIASNCGSVFKRLWYQYNWYDCCNNISMDDIYVAYFMKIQDIKRYVIAHQEGYLKHKVQYAEDEYCFTKYTKQLGVSDKVQTNYINLNFK
jgi:hypothetical protein